MSNTITNLPAAATNTPASTTTLPTQAASNQTLTQQDFLKIMVAQFTQQDPLASSGSGGGSGTSDYVNQMMSMTNLTTMQTMSSQSAMQLASSLPGSTVELNVNNVAVNGVVDSSQLSGGTVYITVGGVQYPASDIISVNQTAAQVAAAAATATNNTDPKTP